MFPEAQLAASLQIAQYATWEGFTVRLEPVGTWPGKPYFSQWYLLYPVSLFLRRLKGRHEWRVVLLEGDEVVEVHEFQDRDTAAARALKILRDHPSPGARTVDAVDDDTSWWVRVEAFVDGDPEALTDPAYDLVKAEFQRQGLTPPLNLGTDQGTGMAEPVIGVVFTLAGDSPGRVVDHAIQLVLDALHAHQQGLYGVSVVSFRNAPPGPPAGFPAIDD